MSALLTRWWLRALPTLCVVMLLSACATAPVDDDLQPVQSPNDDYSYRYLVLENRLPVLLISAPDTPKAAAALDVMVGSGDNPPGRGGLAHFLEHMLFLGTDKYPDSAEYERYITEHGGNRNAYTSFEHTNYFFDINAEHLPEALDRFAQFFIAPRFDAEYVEREKNAVHAEYQMGLKSDSRRGLDVLQEVMNPEHPFSQFSVGSLDSLADRPDATVRDDLLAFYDKHYSANVMRLAVLGRESLDELEQLVVPMFSAVPDHEVQPEYFEQPLFTKESLPMMVELQPQATLRQLQVSFPIADYRSAYHAKPLGYLGNLVGHEGDGSLLSQLKAEGLAESLAAGSGLAWRGGALFSVTVSLTEKGVRERDRVLQLLFAYMDMLREEGPQRWLFDEQAQLAALRFRFQEQAEPINYVSSVASGMHYYSPEDILQGPYMMTEYDSDMLVELMAGIRADNAQVVLSDSSAVTDRVSQYYEVPYSVTLVPNEQLASWQESSAGGSLHLPAKNEFIASDVSLVKSDAVTEDPVVTLQEERKTLWYKADDEFQVPKGALYINFRSPLVGQSAAQNARASLYTALLKDAVNEYAYPAMLAGLHFDLYRHAEGVSLRVSGYNDKQLVLLDRLLATMADSRFEQQRFDNIRKDMVRALENAVAKRPSSQVMDDLGEALDYGRWGEEALIEVLQDLDREALETYGRKFWASTTAEVLLYGNYEQAVVAQVSDRLEGILASGSAPTLPTRHILRLAPAESLQYVVEVPHDDAVLAWYLQGAGDSWRDRAATALAAQVIKSGFFQQLRTEQQLGYVVTSFAWPQREVPGLVMLVQSPNASAAAVAEAMDEFLQGVEPDLDEAQFLRHRDALVAEIRKPDKNLWERAEFYWQSLARKQYDFEGREELAQAVEAFTLADWLAYYREVFMAQRRSLQVVAPGARQALPEGQYRQVHSAEAIKEGHATYDFD